MKSSSSLRLGGKARSPVKPIEIKVTALTGKTPQELQADFLDAARWSEFTGYLLLPGIRRAEFEFKTPQVVGSRIRVQNTDGSRHVEEITVWEADRIEVRFQGFQPPLANLSTHFIETWEFCPSADRTRVTRAMQMFPKSGLARIALLPIAYMMKKAFTKQLRER